MRAPLFLCIPKSVYWLLACALAQPPQLEYGFPGEVRPSLQLDRPSFTLDYRVLEQISDPWIIDARLGRSCLLKNVRVRSRTIDFTFRDDLKWSDGTPIPVTFLKKEFRRLTSSPKLVDLVTLKEGATTWNLSWQATAHTVIHTLQRSEFGPIHEENKQVRSWSQLSPTFGPFRIEAHGERFRLVPNLNYPKDCSTPTVAISFSPINRKNPLDMFFHGPLAILQLDSDRWSDEDFRRLSEGGSTSIGLGTSAVWTALVFGRALSRAERKQWGQFAKDCLAHKVERSLPELPVMELTVTPASASSSVMRTLIACGGNNLKVSYPDAESFAELRKKGDVTTFNHLGLRFPDPDDKWVFLQTNFPNLRESLITPKRLSAARAERKKGSLTGYDALEKANEADPWIILLNNVKTQIFLKRGLKFRSESDSILRLNGIYE